MNCMGGGTILRDGRGGRVRGDVPRSEVGAFLKM